MTKERRLATLRTGIIAGAGGGFAEIVWVATYAWFTGNDPGALARGVTTAAGVDTLLPAASPELAGVVTHMALAAGLGVALLCAWRSLCASRPLLTNPYPFMLAALTGVWTLNFFVVLPLLSPSFVHLAPYAVSLTSKLLFAVAAAATVNAESAFPARASKRATVKGRP